MWLKNAPGWLLIKYAPQVLAEETIKLAGSLGIGISGFRLPDSKSLKMRLTVNAEILWLFPEIRRKRREIQHRRIVNTEYIESFIGK
jgi:hypothetical protein